NAVVIAMAARNLPAKDQKKVIFWGGAAAIGLRVIVTALVAYLLHIPLLQLLGGLALLWIALKLLKGGDEHGESVKASSTMIDAVMTIVVADFVMSLDNMLAVGGASHGNMLLLLMGLMISMGIIMFASSYIAKLMNKWNWLVYVGAGILAYTAAEMIMKDNWLHKVFTPSHTVDVAFRAIAVVAVLGGGYLLSRKNAAAPEAE
ncbi:MAG TPA: YjbE family putative metal transport protein, partial [Symbiobacteriaceae bacterium]|nr:YjbE family putative metal transport protein [Symbiobacteriaceae bacterium]